MMSLTPRTGGRPTPRTMVRAVPLALWLSAGCAMAPAAAQELQLFEAVEQQEEVERPSSDNNQRSRGGNDSGEPMFTLVGTSRFGDQYRARLRSSGGDVVAVEYRPGESVAIPGYPGFQLNTVGARHVIVQHPEHTPCADFSDQGVSCSVGDNSARLTLATAEPVQREEPEGDREAGRENGSEDSGEEGGEERSENPFAAALRAARERSDEDEAALRARAQRFERRRISEDEVPEGYRVVNTPFGDRLVPDE